MQAADTAGAVRIRLDKWLWQARFFRSRTLAAAAVSDGGLRVNGQPVRRPGRAVGAGDVLTVAQGPHVRVIRIRAPGSRRGPAPEAATLYDEIAPPDAPPAASDTPQAGGTGGRGDASGQ